MSTIVWPEIDVLVKEMNEVSVLTLPAAIKEKAQFILEEVESVSGRLFRFVKGNPASLGTFIDEVTALTFLKESDFVVIVRRSGRVDRNF